MVSYCRTAATCGYQRPSLSMPFISSSHLHKRWPLFSERVGIRSPVVCDWLGRERAEGYASILPTKGPRTAIALKKHVNALRVMRSGTPGGKCETREDSYALEIKALQNRLPQQCVRALVGCRSHSRSEPSVRPLLSNSPVSWISLSRLLDECVLSVHQLSSSAPLSLVLFVFGLRQKNVPETF
ncbi:hypothetical protein F2P81_003735 [Scophthalmus maximus]|uniref:Uncharacterized protein n=1 Tax=Scophthalmus maximus TaxID=52904 RepID=A0A6A4TDE6_SCOMX|nr:hypothetical protein F2P81_003735 [Scophthalmus maximus]